MRTLRTILTTFLILPLLGCAPRGDAAAGGGDPALAGTDAGPVRGVVAEGYRQFLGIPYAAPPVGERRWASPAPPEPCTEPRDATVPGPICPQVESGVSGNPGGGDEDCLTVNVTTPDSATADDPKPVMVWLHASGGGDGSGSGVDPHRLAVDGDVVVVTLNYRLGVLGNFGYPGLEGSGGFGLEDQQAALRWVQRNAAAFGGDPGVVTLFGYSGGGFSTCAQLASPGAEGLFHRAAISSGPCGLSFPAGVPFPGQTPELTTIWRSREEIEGIGAAVAAELGCADPATALDCLRALPPEALVPLSPIFSVPGYGTDVLPEDPARVLTEGRFHRVPVISGGTRDEMRFFVAAFHDLAGTPVTAERYPALLAESFGEQAQEVADAYPLEDYPSPGLALATLLTDRVYARPTLAQHRALAAHVPTYAYEFADDQAPPLTFDFPAELPGGAYHGADLFYLFDAAGEEEQAGQDPAQRELSDQMVRAFAAFARTGEPNGEGLPRWEPFPADGSVALSLAPGEGGTAPVDLVTEHRLDFWAGR